MPGPSIPEWVHTLIESLGLAGAGVGYLAGTKAKATINQHEITALIQANKQMTADLADVLKDNIKQAEAIRALQEDVRRIEQRQWNSQGGRSGKRSDGD